MVHADELNLEAAETEFVPDVLREYLGVVEQERDMWKHTASVYENRYKEVKGLEYCQIAVSIVMLLISALLMLLSVVR